jgi:hypothetical protein
VIGGVATTYSTFPPIGVRAIAVSRPKKSVMRATGAPSLTV